MTNSCPLLIVFVSRAVLAVTMLLIMTSVFHKGDDVGMLKAPSFSKVSVFRDICAVFFPAVLIQDETGNSTMRTAVSFSLLPSSAISSYYRQRDDKP